MDAPWLSLKQALTHSILSRGLKMRWQVARDAIFRFSFSLGAKCTSLTHLIFWSQACDAH
jgi:hypothetical protein